MILFDSLKVKQNRLQNTEKVEISIENYENSHNYGYIKCPCCNSTKLIQWGYYERKAIYFKNNKVHIIALKVQRVKCKSCNKTHGILPIGLIPYKQTAIDLIIEALIDANNEDLIEHTNLDTIRYWNKQFKKILPYLITMFKNKSIIDILTEIKKQIMTFYKEYYQQYKNCFLQTKFLYLNMCSL